MAPVASPRDRVAHPTWPSLWCSHSTSRHMNPAPAPTPSHAEPLAIEAAHRAVPPEQCRPAPSRQREHSLKILQMPPTRRRTRQAVGRPPTPAAAPASTCPDGGQKLKTHVGGAWHMGMPPSLPLCPPMPRLSCPLPLMARLGRVMTPPSQHQLHPPLSRLRASPHPLRVGILLSHAHRLWAGDRPRARARRWHSQQAVGR